MSDPKIFATLKGAARIWAVAAIHGEAERLARLHSQIAARFQPQDCIVYLGGYLGRGPAPLETLDELLLFRRKLMAATETDGQSVVYLRGQQEEMWQKLLQIQFSAEATQVLHWMVQQGIGATIAAYGGDAREGLIAAREGTMALTRWTSSLREGVRLHDGHAALLASLRHAAISEDGTLVLVHAGLEPDRTLDEQGDAFWWGGSSFQTFYDTPYLGRAKVVRGYDRRRGGMSLGNHGITLDAGCGFGGPLAAACLVNGGVVEVLEA